MKSIREYIIENGSDIDLIESPDIRRRNKTLAGLRDNLDRLKKAYIEMVNDIYSSPDERRGVFATYWELHKYAKDVDDDVRREFCSRYGLPKFPSQIKKDYTKREALDLVK